jgi:hypothetical protein
MRTKVVKSSVPIAPMPPTADLDDAEKATLAALLRQVIAADPFPMSPRIRALRTILDKLEPASPRPQPHPAPKPAGESSLLYRKLRGGGRRRG